MFEFFKGFAKSDIFWRDETKYFTWYRKTFERPRRKKK